ncbi:hypothetical protein GCM10027612_09450 [Microbispora bryophytorum subsp. camponoti]
MSPPSWVAAVRRDHRDASPHFRPDSHRSRVNRRAPRNVFGNKEARMDVLESLVDDELRLELIVIEALHHEAERLAAPAVR